MKLKNAFWLLRWKSQRHIYNTLTPEPSAVSWFHIFPLWDVSIVLKDRQQIVYWDSSCFSEFAVGLKTHWRSEQKGRSFFIVNDKHTVYLCTRDKAYGLSEVKTTEYAVYIYILFMHSIHWLSLLSCREILLQAPLLLPSVWLCSEKEACSLPCSSHCKGTCFCSQVKILEEIRNWLA